MRKRGRKGRWKLRERSRRDKSRRRSHAVTLLPYPAFRHPRKTIARDVGEENPQSSGCHTALTKGSVGFSDNHRDGCHSATGIALFVKPHLAQPQSSTSLCGFRDLSHNAGVCTARPSCCRFVLLPTSDDSSLNTHTQGFLLSNSSSHQNAPQLRSPLESANTPTARTLQRSTATIYVSR